MRMKRALLAVLCAVAALSVALPTIALADDSSSNGSEDNKYYYDKVVNTGLDNGYSESNSIKEGTPTSDGSLAGSSSAASRAERATMSPCFLKTVAIRLSSAFSSIRVSIP
ncbi:hypothetical protein [Collinsella aerofaciens]|uniref:hypothetical protein n=1 Tax=Collinsella aerofaciens TaxID=74426 RepID=UPI00359C7E38